MALFSTVLARSALSARRPLVISKSLLRCLASSSSSGSVGGSGSTTGATTNMIVNAVGLDRPGIVSDLTKYVTNAGGNVGQSQAARLGNYFSIMMQITVPKNQVDALQEALNHVDNSTSSNNDNCLADLHTSLFETTDSHGVENVTSKPHIAYSGQFELEGASYPGIVHKVTALLASHGLNIETMGTVEEIAPHGGTTLFRMKGVAHAFEPLPKSFDANQVRDELHELGDTLNCELELRDLDQESYSGTFYGGATA